MSSNKKNRAEAIFADQEHMDEQPESSQLAYAKKLITIDGHKGEMIQNFNKFRSENLFTDIFIYVEGVEFACHKVVLCAASSYFKAMFSCDLKESRLGKVFIENISPWTMKRLLDFIYTGKIEITYENVIEIFNSAVMFQLSKLADKCSDYIHDHIDHANCVEIHVFSSMHQLEQLENSTFQYILDNFMQLINLQSIGLTLKADSLLASTVLDIERTNSKVYFGDFVRLNELTFSNLIKSDLLNVSREIYVYYALKKWMDYRMMVNESQHQSQKAFLASQNKVYENLFKHIRLNALTQNELEYILCNDLFVKSNSKLTALIKYYLNSSASVVSQTKKVLQEHINANKSNLNNENKQDNTNDTTQITYEDNSSKPAKIRPSTIPREYLCFLRANQFKYYDFYKSKWDTLNSWPPSFQHTNSTEAKDTFLFFNRSNEPKQDANTSSLVRPSLSGYSTCLINNILFVIGGHLMNSNTKSNSELSLLDTNNDANHIELVDCMWRFDPIKNEWISCQKMLRKRAFHISVSVQSKMSSDKTKTVNPLDIIFLFYGLCYSEGSPNDESSSLPLKQCLSIEFYNLETNQWSLLKSTSNTLLDHQIFQTINYQNRLVLTGNAEGENEPVNNLNLLNQLIEHQLSQSKSIITLKNLIYILKENCINCYEFDLSLEQLVCLPYFRLPSNLSSFVLAAAFPVKTLPTSTLSLFSWNCESDEEESVRSVSESKSHDDDLDSIQEECDDEQMALQNKKEVVIYLLNAQAGILYQFYPAKNKLKKMPNLLLKHSTNETALLYIKSKLYVTGGLSEHESDHKEAATAIEVFDEDKESWSVFMDKIDTRVSPSSSAFSLVNTDLESASNDSVKFKKHFFKLKMSLV